MKYLLIAVMFLSGCSLSGCSLTYHKIQITNEYPSNIEVGMNNDQ